MNWSKRTWVSVMSLTVLAAGMAVAQNWHRHPNLAAADQATREALQALHAAQRANHWDMAGHAARAEQLLRQADGEIRASAIAANR
jgi:hypothetical protein